ncbi:unnamed protein product [Schistosoma turkestanicum]|nr:unnamed protein product [Schistosoma turkestanicum]
MTVPVENVRDVLSVRVMRLNRPTFVIQRCESTELYLDDIAGCLTTSDAGIRGDLDGVALNLLSNGNIPFSSNLKESLNCDTALTNDSKENYDCGIQPKVGGYSELLSLTHSFGLKIQLPTFGDIQVRVSSLPPTVTTEQPFTMKFELTNCSKMNLDLILSLHSFRRNASASIPLQSSLNDKENTLNNEQNVIQCINNCYLSPIVWLSRTKQKLGKLSPGQCVPFELNLMATVPGLHMISGLCIHELTMNRDYEFNNLAHVLVFANNSVPM